MSFDEKYQALAATIDPRKQVICKHVGVHHPTHGWQVEPRKDGDGDPLLSVFTKKAMQQVNHRKYGWEPYEMPGSTKPKVSRPAKRKTSK